jgi:uncharacterized protein
MHRRLYPRVHHFRYRAFWLLVNLDELSQLSGKLSLFSHNRPNVFSLYDTDHGDGSATPLRSQLERQLGAAGVDLAGGPIRLLCLPRTFGYDFNPLSVYFCYHANGALAALIYQVHNTFHERHSYVIPVERESRVIRQSCRKSFFVSPFMDTDMRYDFRLTQPNERISLAISAHSSTKPVFHAVLRGARHDFTDRALIAMGVAIPAVTLKVITAIHWQGLRLWSKGARWRRRPLTPTALIPIRPRAPD